VINGKNGKTLLESMLNSIKYENWYLSNSYLGSTFAIGRTHLGVLNPEAQPIFNEDGSLGIFMDGEVYDYDKQKRNLESNGHKFKVGNDAEFCLHLYEEYGEDFVKNLNGSFVIIIFDTQNRKMIVANDRFRLRPFYYAKNGEKYLFASEVKAILEDKKFEKKICHQAVADFFAFQKIWGDKTFFEGITALPPASIMILSEGELSIRKYWDFKFPEKRNRPKEYYVDNLVPIFRRAVERRMKGNHSTGVSLSGGLDSRSIVAAINKEHYPIRTFTYGVRGGDEARIAEKVAKKLGTTHRFFELKRDFLVDYVKLGVRLTDGMSNCWHFHWMSLLEQIAKDVDIVFHGLGMDLLVGGWVSHRGVRARRRMLKAKNDAVLATILYQRFRKHGVSDIKKLFSDAYYQKIKDMPIQSFKKALKEAKAKHPGDIIDYIIWRDYTKTSSSPARRSYVEDRVPGYDNDVVDLILEIPPALRSEQRIYYDFFIKLAPHLAKIPYQATGFILFAPFFLHQIGRLVKSGYKEFIHTLRNVTRGRVSIVDRTGYPDYNEWIRRDVRLRKFFEDILLDERTLNRGYFNENYVHELVVSHMSSRKDHGKELCALLTFELWHRLFVDARASGK
jgi:asparagine synthase (glutamine-hydrolysing)